MPELNEPNELSLYTNCLTTPDPEKYSESLEYDFKLEYIIIELWFMWTLQIFFTILLINGLYYI